jgi:2',3'-cyclic-nucleotide 2'-phosphodiesterase (5'-nucleotidase family)
MKLIHYFFIVFYLFVVGCAPRFIPSKHTETVLVIKSSETDTISSIDKYLKPFRDSINGIMNIPIGEAQADLRKERPSGSLGNMVADALLKRAQSQYPSTVGAICNYGGIRINQIPKGKISKGKIFELLPFENELIILEVKGNILNEWMQHIAKDGGWPIAFSSKVVIESSKNQSGLLDSVNEEDGGSSIKTRIESKQYFNEQDTYYIATNDYVANGGDNCNFLKPCKQIKTGLIIRDVVLGYIQTKKIITPDNTIRLAIIH